MMAKQTLRLHSMLILSVRPIREKLQLIPMSLFPPNSSVFKTFFFKTFQQQNNYYENIHTFRSV